MKRIVLLVMFMFAVSAQAQITDIDKLRLDNYNLAIELLRERLPRLIKERDELIKQLQAKEKVEEPVEEPKED